MRMKSLEWAHQVERLLARIEAHGVSCAEGAGGRLVAYCKAVAEATGWLGLVSPKDVPLLVEKHVAPSIGPLFVEPPASGARWIDVGTGGGFPGMVIKLCRPNLDITLVDSSRKKTIFLERVRSELAMEDLKILEARAEELPVFAGLREQAAPGSDSTIAARPEAKTPEAFDVILMRAVASLPRALPLVDSIADSGTRLLTFKGPAWDEELAAAREVLNRHRWRYDGTYKIPWARPRILKIVKD
jgi:16S rRNA (guanine527-N7)-methyltransferase